MNPETKRQLLDYILFYLIISLIGVIVVLITYLKKDSIQCLSDPINYYENLKNVVCSCQEITSWNNFSNLNLSIQ